MEMEHLIQLIEAVSESELCEFSYEENGVKLKLKKDGVKAASDLPFVMAGQTVPAAELPKEMKQEESPQGQVVASPLVGTFYEAPSPEDKPFVQVGDRVSKGQVLGIVEAMKLMNEIESEYDGVVKEILVSNGDVIEYGQPMFVIA